MTKEEIIEHIKSNGLPEGFISLVNNETLDGVCEGYWHEPKFFFDALKSGMTLHELFPFYSNFDGYTLCPLFETGLDYPGSVVISMKSKNDHKFIKVCYEDRSDYKVIDNIQKLSAELVIDIHEGHEGEFDCTNLSKSLGFEHYEEFLKEIEPMYTQGLGYKTIKAAIDNFIKKLKDLDKFVQSNSPSCPSCISITNSADNF